MTALQMETLYQEWLTKPKPRRPDDNKVMKPLLLFHYVGGYRVGARNGLVRMPRRHVSR